MSTTAAAVTVIAFLIVVLPAVHWLMCHFQAAASTRDRLIAEAHQRADSYAGPDSLRLMQDLDEHLDAYAAQLSGLYERLGPPPSPDPIEVGRERLWDAVRDNQNQHKGES